MLAAAGTLPPESATGRWRAGFRATHLPAASRRRKTRPALAVGYDSTPLGTGASTANLLIDSPLFCQSTNLTANGSTLSPKSISRGPRCHPTWDPWESSPAKPGGGVVTQVVGQWISVGGPLNTLAFPSVTRQRHGSRRPSTQPAHRAPWRQSASDRWSDNDGDPIMVLRVRRRAMLVAAASCPFPIREPRDSGHVARRM